VTDLSASSIVGGTVSLLGRAPWRATAAFVVTTGLAVGVDLMAASGVGGAAELNLILSVVNLVMQFWLTAALLQDLGLRTSSGGGFGAMFVVGLVTTLGIIAGTVLLVVPGIVLAVRWSASIPYALADGYDGVGDAIGRSWRGTQGHAWSIFLALLLCYGLVLGATFTLGFLEGVGGENIAIVIALDAGMQLGLIAGWHAAVAIYTLVERPRGLSQVFA
jgi:hypothetical protein